MQQKLIQLYEHGFPIKMNHLENILRTSCVRAKHELLDYFMSRFPHGRHVNTSYSLGIPFDKTLYDFLGHPDLSHNTPRAETFPGDGLTRFDCLLWLVQHRINVEYHEEYLPLVTVEQVKQINYWHTIPYLIHAWTYVLQTSNSCSRRFHVIITTTNNQECLQLLLFVVEKTEVSCQI